MCSLQFIPTTYSNSGNLKKFIRFRPFGCILNFEVSEKILKLQPKLMINCIDVLALDVVGYVCFHSTFNILNSFNFNNINHCHDGVSFPLFLLILVPSFDEHGIFSNWFLTKTFWFFLQ